MEDKKRKEIRRITLGKIGFFLMIFSFFLLFDQITKYSFKSAFTDGNSTTGSFIRFGFLLNPSTTMFAAIKLNIHPIAIIFMNLGLFIFALIFVLLTTDKWYAIIVSIVAAGIFGNMADRIFNKGVIDWISFPWVPNALKGFFNLADAYVVIGLVWLGIYTIINIWNKEEKR